MTAQELLAEMQAVNEVYSLIYKENESKTSKSDIMVSVYALQRKYFHAATQARNSPDKLALAVNRYLVCENLLTHLGRNKSLLERNY